MADSNLTQEWWMTMRDRIANSSLPEADRATALDALGPAPAAAQTSREATREARRNEIETQREARRNEIEERRQARWSEIEMQRETRRNEIEERRQAYRNEVEMQRETRRQEIADSRRERQQGPGSGSDRVAVMDLGEWSGPGDAERSGTRVNIGRSDKGFHYAIEPAEIAEGDPELSWSQPYFSPQEAQEMGERKQHDLEQEPELHEQDQNECELEL